MADFSVIPAQPWHCGQMIRRLRHEHHRAVSSIGIDSHRELRRLFDASSFRRAWLIAGRLAALGGVEGTLLSPFGFIWLALTEEATAYPVAIVKEARRQLESIMATKRELVTTLLPGDEAAKRLAIFLGFHISHGGLGERAYSRAGRRTLAHYVEAESECHVPLGRGAYAIAMGYHEAH
jgi:hypothetical protein